MLLYLRRMDKKIKRARRLLSNSFRTSLLQSIAHAQQMNLRQLGQCPLDCIILCIKWFGDRVDRATRIYDTTPILYTCTNPLQAHGQNPLEAKMVQLCDNHVGQKGTLAALAHGSKKSNQALRPFNRIAFFQLLSRASRRNLLRAMLAHNRNLRGCGTK